MKQEPKNESRGRGRGRKETLADKPLDFENIARECVTLTKPPLPSPLNARFLGTPSESVRHNPRNVCANFGASTQKCAKRPFFSREATVLIRELRGEELYERRSSQL